MRRNQVEVGDIVLLPYAAFTGEIRNGLFLVVYHEKYNDEGFNTNFTGIKISSREYKYSVALSAKHVPALDHDSYVNVNQQHRFTEDQVIRVLGRLNRPSLRIVILQLQRYYENIRQQISYKCYDTDTPHVESHDTIIKDYYSDYIRTGIMPEETKDGKGEQL